MLTLLTVATALVCLLLMGVVLIQNPKGGGLDSTFGANANQMLGAAKTSDFVEKLTWGLAAALLLLCLFTSMFVGNKGNNSRTQGDTSSIEIPVQETLDAEETYYI